MQESNVTEKTYVQPLWFSVLRIFLGLYLLWKGIVFIRDTTLLEQLIERTGVGVFSQNSSTLSFVVAYLSLLCGLFIATGLFTKLSSVIQIPILIVAVFFVNINRIDTSAAELVLSIITLCLLIFFAIKGSGSLSADEFFRSYYKAGTEDGQTKKFFTADKNAY
ncbi:MAG: DoxX family protein [Ginsengibacter sp.]